MADGWQLDGCLMAAFMLGCRTEWEATPLVRVSARGCHGEDEDRLPQALPDARHFGDQAQVRTTG